MHDGRNVAIFRWLVIERYHGDLEKFIQNSLPGMKREMVDSKIVLMQISTGLSYLHEKGIVHRNLKSQNILLQLITPNIVLFKLADFGFGKQQRPIAPEVDKCYTAPELLNCDENVEPTFESDVWALGVIFHYVLSGGQRQFEDKPSVESRDWAAADLITQLMHKDPKDRPKSCLVLYHPYFSLTNQSTKTLLAKQLFDLHENVEGFYLDAKQVKNCPQEALKSDLEDEVDIVLVRYCFNFNMHIN